MTQGPQWLGRRWGREARSRARGSWSHTAHPGPPGWRLHVSASPDIPASGWAVEAVGPAEGKLPRKVRTAEHPALRLDPGPEQAAPVLKKRRSSPRAALPAEEAPRCSAGHHPP